MAAALPSIVKSPCSTSPAGMPPQTTDEALETVGSGGHVERSGDRPDAGPSDAQQVLSRELAAVDVVVVDIGHRQLGVQRSATDDDRDIGCGQ